MEEKALYGEAGWQQEMSGPHVIPHICAGGKSSGYSPGMDEVRSQGTKYRAGIPQAWSEPRPPRLGCVMLGVLPNLSEPWVPHLQNGDNSCLLTVTVTNEYPQDSAGVFFEEFEL